MECQHDDTVEYADDPDGTIYKCDLCGEEWFEPFE